MEEEEVVRNDVYIGASSAMTLECPDVDDIRLQRLGRTRAALQAFDPVLARSVLPPNKAENDASLSREVLAAVCIQCHYRGYVGRKKYVQALIDKFNQEEAMRMKKIQQQVEEGELLIENHKLQVEFEDNHCIRRNRTQLFVSRVITIQRAWRYYKKQQQQQKQQKEHQDHTEFKENYKKDEDDDNNDENTFRQLDGNGNPKPVGNSVEDKYPANNQQTYNCSGDKMSMLTKLSADNQPDIIQGLTHHSPDLHNENESYLKRPKDLDKKNTNLNRLSLAEEFAQLEGKIFADDGAYESESESDYGATPSSCMTTPDWEAQEEFSKADESQDNITVTEDLNNEADENHDTTTTVCNGLQKDNDGNVADLDANANDSDTSETHINELQTSRSQKHLEILTEKRTMSTEINTKTEPNRTSNKEDIAKDIDITCKQLAAATITAAACDHRQVLPKDNIDSSGLPIMDWDTLERRIANIERKKGEKAKELEKQEEKEQSSKSPKTAQRSCRQEILKRLARAGLSEEDAEGDIYGKGRDKLSARLQSGMNLQICFMNDPLSDDDEDVQYEAAMIRSLQSPSVTVTKVDEDFETRQARLQDEAKIALAQAQPMAKMQLEIEKVHGKKVSPVTELAGVKGMCDISPGLSGKALSKKKLHAMSCGKLKILVSDLHRRIKDWNEELVELLIARDELKNEQDSKLIDIEDLTRHAAEQQEQQQLVRRVLSGKWP